MSGSVRWRVASYAPPATGSTGALILAVRPAAGNTTIDSFALTGDRRGGDWSGNETLSIGNKAATESHAGGLSDTAGPFDCNALQSFSGVIARALYWNSVSTVASRARIAEVSRQGGRVSVRIEGLVSGATYRLFRDTTLPLGASRVEVRFMLAGAGPETFVDDRTLDPLPLRRAFYQVEEER